MDVTFRDLKSKIIVIVFARPIQPASHACCCPNNALLEQRRLNIFFIGAISKFLAVLPCAITRIVLLLCIVHALVHTIVRISLLLPWLPVRFASVLVLHFDSLLNKRGRSFEVSALIIGVVSQTSNIYLCYLKVRVFLWFVSNMSYGTGGTPSKDV